MTARIFNGRAAATDLQRGIAADVSSLTKQYQTPPNITTVIVGEDPASLMYLKLRDAACTQVGVHSHHRSFPATASENEVLDAIKQLNDDPSVHGILIQYPLPARFHPLAFMRAVDPSKDVEGFHPVNLGRTLSGDECLVPCTPLAVLTILAREGFRLKGADTVIVNHSNVVGKPLAALLVNRDATVTVCHVFTTDLFQYTTAADILVTGSGVANLITAEHIKQGACVIDVGIAPTPEGIRGDVMFESVQHKAGFLTPVPGGVGPVTISMALSNMVKTFTMAMENR